MATAPSARIIVTGAARGLGAAIARMAAAEYGADVGVLDVNADAALAVATDIAATGKRAVALAANTSNELDIEAALDSFAAEMGGPADSLVNNAAIRRTGNLLDLDARDWRQVVDVNLTGTFLMARAFARRAIAADQRGAIVNITSMNGVAAVPEAGAYGSTKAAVALLTQQMAIEWGAKGIRVNAVAPGLIDAGMSDPIYADQVMREAHESKVPLGRLGVADDIARVVLFLLSEDAAYVTGQNLVVDGGVTMSMISR